MTTRELTNMILRISAKEDILEKNNLSVLPENFYKNYIGIRETLPDKAKYDRTVMKIHKKRVGKMLRLLAINPELQKPPELSPDEIILWNNMVDLLKNNKTSSLHNL